MTEITIVAGVTWFLVGWVLTGLWFRVRALERDARVARESLIRAGQEIALLNALLKVEPPMDRQWEPGHFVSGVEMNRIHVESVESLTPKENARPA
jgi:hypothetical protein